MADDVEIDIGVQLDESQFQNSFNKFLSTLKGETVLALQEALDNVKGTAAKNWSSLPYQTMHTSTGAASASQAFAPGFAADLQRMGVSQDEFNSALLSAMYKSSVPSAEHRFNLLHSYGQNAPLPGSNIERVLSTDYSLMAMPWSRAFFRQQELHGLQEEDLKGLKVAELKAKAGAYGIHIKSGSRKQDIIDTLVNQTNGTNLTADFAGMRDYAVEQGIGRWLDPDKEHTADNFELINDALEDISDNSEKTDKSFRGWSDNLKSTLGTLTAIGKVIGGLAGSAIGATLAFNAKAEKGTVSAGETLDRRRAFVGMSALDELSAQVAGQAVGLGKNAVTNEVISLSGSREQYKLLGEGLNALYPSLTDTFDNIMSQENPLDVYKGILTEVYNQMLGADDTKRAQTLMLLQNQGLGSAAHIIGAFLSNPALGNDPTSLFNLTSNGYYGSFERAEALLPDLTKLNKSIEASYSQMYTDWVAAFGKPFKTWWDNTLKNTVVPWFETILNFVTDPVKDTLKYALPGEPASVMDAYSKAIETFGEGNKADTVEGSADAWRNARDTVLNGRNTSVTIPAGAKTKAGFWDFFGWGVSPSEVMEGLNGGNDDPKAFLRALRAAANPESYNEGALDNEDTKYFMYSAQNALSWLERTGYLSTDFENAAYGNEKSGYTMDVIRAYLAGGNSSTQTDVLEAYLENTVLQSPGWQAMEEFFTTYKEYLQKDTQTQQKIIVELRDAYGNSVADRARAIIEK